MNRGTSEWGWGGFYVMPVGLIGSIGSRCSYRKPELTAWCSTLNLFKELGFFWEGIIENYSSANIFFFNLWTGVCVSCSEGGLAVFAKLSGITTLSYKGVQMNGVGKAANVL